MVKKFGMGVLLKDIFREIAKTKNRFLSIFLIVAIGVGFFAGLTASGPDMKLTKLVTSHEELYKLPSMLSTAESEFMK